MLEIVKYNAEVIDENFFLKMSVKIKFIPTNFIQI
jgi:hypothetical protein